MRNILKSLLVVLFAFTVLGTSAQAANSPVFHSPNTGSNYIAYDLLKTGADAETYCINRGGHLAVINNHTEATELFTAMNLMLPGGAMSEEITNYTIGEYILANSTVQKNVTVQTFYIDPAYTYGNYYYGFDGTAVNYKRYLQLDSFGVTLFYTNMTTTTRKFICEFEDAPI